jgi:SAM-dependent methyltransferase
MWYHKYVYDERSRTLVGEFEELYRDGAHKGLDAWHQDSLSLREDVVIADAMLASMNDGRVFRTVVDLGCGKGVLAHHLFSGMNRYVGIDVSETAVSTARQRFPTMEFVLADIQTGHDLSEVISKCDLVDRDLFFSCQTLSFMHDWKGIIEEVTKSFTSVLIILYVPANPIGYIKSFGGLVDEVGRNFGEISCMYSTSGSHIAISGQSLRSRHPRSESSTTHRQPQLA